MDITTIEKAAATLAEWKERARNAPARGPQASLRRRVRDLEILLSITAKRVSEAQRASADLAAWLAAQTAGAEEAANSA